MEIALSNEELMRGTGAGLVEFFTNLAVKGRMAKPTAANFRLSCQTVLETVYEAGWVDVDMKRMDVEDVFSRFVILKAGLYTTGSFSAYKSRFYNGTNMYLGFLQDPQGWKPPLKMRTAAPKPSVVNRSGSEKVGTADTAVATSTTTTNNDAPHSELLTHHYPLRPGVRAVLSLPEDLTKREATRLATFIQALAVEDQPALSQAQGE